MMTSDQITNYMKHCTLCPRNCGADRVSGKTGVCGMTAEIMAARAALHFWEEPCISGNPQDAEMPGNGRGSGTVFFSGCNLRCVYCQNSEVAAGRAGKIISQERLADIFLELQDRGAYNINLVTPTPWVPQIISAAENARMRGLGIPFVYNCGGYESPEVLRMLEGITDVYLTDFKYMEEEAARRYSAASDYPERAALALQEMVRQVPSPVFDDSGMMQKGVIVRHLLLPGMVTNAKKVVRHVYSRYGDAVWLSLMRQYTPFPGVKQRYPELDRRVTAREYRRLVRFALSEGVQNCFIQEGGTAKESFVPAFDGEGL